MYNTPVKFDENEWLVLASAIVIFWMLFPYLGASIDYLLGSRNWLDLYDTMDTILIDWYDLLTYNLCYSIYGYLFCHFYKVIKRLSPRYIKFYILGWSAQTALLEWFSALFGVFTYKGWHPFTSFPFYLLLFGSLSFFIATLERWWEQENQLQKVS